MPHKLQLVTRQAETTGQMQGGSPSHERQPIATQRLNSSGIALAPGHAWVERRTHVDQWTCPNCCAFARVHKRVRWFGRDRDVRVVVEYATARNDRELANPKWGKTAPVGCGR